MQVNPDTVHPKIPWGSGPWSSRAVGLMFFAFAVGNAVIDLSAPTTATLTRTVAAGTVGLVWGLGIWLIDRWWDQRPAMHVVTEDFAHEVKRQGPAWATMAFGFLVFYRFGGGGDGLYGVTATLVMMATDLVLVSPTLVHRRFVRRNLRAGLVGP